MTLLNVERIKLFSTRSPYWCLALIPVIGIAITLITSLVATAALALTGCGNDDPLDSSSDGGDAGTIRVGSANFPESVVLAEVYAKALEDAGFTVVTTITTCVNEWT